MNDKVISSDIPHSSGHPKKMYEQPSSLRRRFHKAMMVVKHKYIDAWLCRAFAKNDEKILEQN